MQSFFLQRLNLVPRSYINLDITQFPRNFGQFAQKSAETFILWKILSRMETIIHFRKNMISQPLFYY